MKTQSKTVKPIILGVILVFVVVLFGNKISGGEKLKSVDDKDQDALAEILSQIEGVGKIKIYYSDNRPEKDDSLSQYFSLSDQNVTPVEKDEKGILIVAEGGGDPTIKNLLSKTIATVLQLPEHKIVIVEMKQGEDIN